MLIEPMTVSVPTAARALGISRSLAFKLCLETNLEGSAFKLGQRWVVSIRRLNDLIDRDHRQQAEEAEGGKNGQTM